MHFVTTPVLSCLVHLLFITMFATCGFGQIYHVKEMNTEQIRALDREKTVVVIPGGITNLSAAQSSDRDKAAGVAQEKRTGSRKRVKHYSRNPRSCKAGRSFCGATEKIRFHSQSPDS